MNLSIPAWEAWHVALALGVLSLALYVFSRVQFGRASEDWANAFFYSPSQKAKHRQRRQRWQDRSWAFLAGVVISLIAAVVLYFLTPR
ncbi:MAG: hypothetical protein HY332_21390 [Chloroflexi bacterium]|nr:hypothetical protein [Chloroflexota bacterium]